MQTKERSLNDPTIERDELENSSCQRATIDTESFFEVSSRTGGWWWGEVPASIVQNAHCGIKLSCCLRTKQSHWQALFHHFMGWSPASQVPENVMASFHVPGHRTQPFHRIRPLF